MRFLFLLFLLCPLSSIAQISIYGTVKDDAGETVPYAQVILKSLPDSVIIKGDIADSGGSFKLEFTSIAGLLQVHSAGYADKYVVLGEQANQVVNIVLKPDTRELKTVSITASKPLLERRADRMIFNVGSSVSAIGSDAYEMLKKAPGVRVSENSGISLAGKSTVSVMIDNRIQQVGSMELAAILRSIPAETIEKIEVITTPPAKYDAQGNSGIINIVTKRSSKDGLNGSIGATYMQRLYGSERISENLNYRKGKLNIYSSGNTNNLKFQSEQKTTVPYGAKTQEQLLLQTNNPLYNRYQLGADYNISPKSVVGALFTIGSANRTTDQYYNAPVTSLGKLDSTLRTIAEEREYSLRNVANLNYEWRIDTTGKKLNIDVDYFTRTQNDDRDFTNQAFAQDGTGLTPLYNKSAAKQRIDISSAKADMIWPVKSVELSFGAKISSIHTNSDNRFYRKYLNDYVIDPTRTNEFDYTENTQAAYTSASRKWDKVETQFGLRLENTQTKGISYALLQTDTNYLLLFPTAYVLYSPSENHAININYSRRVGRPSFEELNPFRQYGTGTSYRTGNPFLQPSFYHMVELGYAFQSKYIFTVYTGIVDNMHARISQVDTANNTFYFTNVNAGSSYNTGASTVMVFTPFTWWEANIQVQAYYDRISSNYYSGTARVNGIAAWQAQTTNNFIFNKQRTLLAELSFSYQSRFQYDFIEHGAYYSLGAGIKALLFDKKLTAGLTAFDMLRSEFMNFRNIYNGVYEESYYDSRAIHASISWKFGNNKIKAKRQRETETEEMRRSQ